MNRRSDRIARGSDEKLTLGNLGIHRDWGWAPEYVEAMWRMLQRETADDFIIATGVSNSLEDFVHEAFSRVDLDWRDHTLVSDSLFRPTDITDGKGNAGKAARLLGWQAKAQMKDVIAMMVSAEMEWQRQLPSTVAVDRRKRI